MSENIKVITVNTLHRLEDHVDKEISIIINRVCDTTSPYDTKVLKEIVLIGKKAEMILDSRNLVENITLDNLGDE